MNKHWTLDSMIIRSDPTWEVIFFAVVKSFDANIVISGNVVFLNAKNSIIAAHLLSYESIIYLCTLEQSDFKNSLNFHQSFLERTKNTVSILSQFKNPLTSTCQVSSD